MRLNAINILLPKTVVLSVFAAAALTLSAPTYACDKDEVCKAHKTACEKECKVVKVKKGDCKTSEAKCDKIHKIVKTKKSDCETSEAKCEKIYKVIKIDGADCDKSACVAGEEGKVIIKKSCDGELKDITSSQSFTVDTGGNVFIKKGCDGAVQDLTSTHSYTVDTEGNIAIGSIGAQAEPFVISGGKLGFALAADEKTIELSIDGEEISVLVDGEEVPAEQIKLKGGKVIILGEDGEEIESIRLGLGGDAGRAFGFTTDETMNMLYTAEAEPKVMLGIHLGEPGEALMRHLDLEAGETTLVPLVYVGLPAYEAGVREYDIITMIDGEGPASPQALRDALAEMEPGDDVLLTIIHEGDLKMVKVELDAYDREAMEGAEFVGEAPKEVDLPRQLWIPKDMKMPEGFHFEMPELNKIYIDEDHKVFEMPAIPPMEDLRDRYKKQYKKQYKESDEGEPRIDSRLEGINERLAELEEMLDRLLEQAEKHERR